MSLMTKYDALVKYLEEKEYHGDPELERMIDRLGVDCQEADESIESFEDRIREIKHFRKYGWEG